MTENDEWEDDDWVDAPAYYIYTPTVPGTYEVDDDTPVHVTDVMANDLNTGLPVKVVNGRGYPVTLVPRPIRLQKRI